MTANWSGISNEIECDGCANSIKRALGRVEGIESVEVDVPSKSIRVAYNDGAVSPSVIEERLASAGFPVIAG